MYRRINVRDKNISVRLQEDRIMVKSDDQLSELLTEMPEAATDELICLIKNEYHTQLNKNFDVEDASIAVEIWGHVYAEKFANAIRKIAPLKLADELAEKICSSCEVINIGTKDHDGNRFVWDWLATFKPAIARLL